MRGTNEKGKKNRSESIGKTKNKQKKNRVGKKKYGERGSVENEKDKRETWVTQLKKSLSEKQFRKDRRKRRPSRT